MAFNLGGLATGLSAMGGALPQAEDAWAQVQQRQRALADLQRQDQARRAFFQSLTTPDMAALPQQGAIMPGDAQAPAPAPNYGGGGVPGQNPQLATGGVPSGSAAASPPAPSGVPMVLPSPLARLRQMALAIKQANPGADPLTLSAALEQEVATLKGLDPDERAAMQAQVQIMRVQEAANAAITRANSAVEVANIRAEAQGQIANIRAQMAANSAGAQDTLDPRTGVFLGQALIAGDTQTISQFLGFSRNRVAIMQQVVRYAQQIDPSFTGAKAAAAIAKFSGMKTGANVVGRTAGSVAVGAAEIPPLSDVIDALGKINRTQFPTVNAVVNAVRRGTGNADVVKLFNYIQTLRYAYSQIAARGGRITDQVRETGEKLVTGNMPLSQLEAATEVMRKEAAIVKRATGTAMQDVTGTEQPPAPPAADAAAVPPSAPAPGAVIFRYDAEGNPVP